MRNTINEFFLRLISVIVTLALKRQFFYINLYHKLLLHRRNGLDIKDDTCCCCCCS